MSIGLYDIDLWHNGREFSLSLPLMKIYNYFYHNNQQVIMMKKDDDTGRFEKIFYFKDNPNTKIPRTFNLDMEKGKLVGYGFYGESGITKQEIKNTSLSFTPYDLLEKYLNNKTAYKSIKRNGIIDWREKDFTYVVDNKPIIYINDRDFFYEKDFLNCMEKYKNRTIRFLHSNVCKTYYDAEKILNYKITNSAIILPWSVDYDKVKRFSQIKNFKLSNEENTTDDVFKLLFAEKVLSDKSDIAYRLRYTSDNFQNDLINWGRYKERISFKDFMGDKFIDTNYNKYPYKILLKQNPKNFTEQDLIKNNIL